MPERPFVYRFTRDLRLDDHAGLAEAAAHGPLLALLVIDPAIATRLRNSPRRAAFFCNAVAALDRELRERGSRLVVRRGALPATICGFANHVDAIGVAWSAGYDLSSMEDDRTLQSALEEAGHVARIVHDSPIVGPETTAAIHSEGGGYRAFSPYFQAWSQLPVPSYEYPLLMRFFAEDIGSEPLPEPSEFGSDARCGEAGPAAAQRDFKRFLRENAAQYATNSHLPSADRTSRLSSHLSLGSISARSIARAIRQRLVDPFALSEERVSLRFYLRALAHRDFFLQLSWFNPQTQDEPLQEKMRGFQWSTNHAALDAWRSGETGYPLVDAGIRQLHATGWMHPLVRAVAASWLAFDLGVDWRLGRREWDRWLVEDDPALATGNWQWIAGVGADMAQYPRIYNPERQRRRYDPAGEYVRRWIPELRQAPPETWFGRESTSPQLTLALYAQRQYPRPAVDHERAARAFLRRYREFVAA